MTPKTASAAIKQRVFSDYQRMLTFAINLGYKDVPYNVKATGNSWTVRYQG